METKTVIENIKRLDKGGRDKFKQLCAMRGLEYGEPKNEKLAYDCYFKYKGKTYIVELKDRDLSCDKYDDLILERDKYERVMKHTQKLGANGCYYINFIGDTAYIFNLMQDYITKDERMMWMNECTAESNKKVKKDVYMLPKSKAKRITLK